MNIYALLFTTSLLVMITHFFMWWLRRDTPILIQAAYTCVMALSAFFLSLVVKAAVPMNDYFLLIVVILYGIFMYDGAFKRSIVESDKELQNKNKN